MTVDLCKTLLVTPSTFSCLATLAAVLVEQLVRRSKVRAAWLLVRDGFRPPGLRAATEPVEL
jgi:hypothetical protein